MSLTKNILQICPHDSAPFGRLCGNFVAAGNACDAQVTSIFLGPATAAPLDYAHYLDIEDLTDTKAIVIKLGAYLSSAWDLVICHRYRSYRVAVTASLIGFPCVVLAHEYSMLERWQRRWHRKLFASDCRFAGVAPAIAAELEQATGHSLVLPNCLDIDAALGALVAKEAALAELGLEPGPWTIGVVGRLHYKKRPELALQAFQAYAEHAGQSRDVRLVFLGEGEARTSLEAAAPPNVEFLGAVPDAARLFQGFDVLLHTANAEPFGMVVLEALLAGVPVVTLNAHGPRFVLGDLGVYACVDTAQGFAQALRCAETMDRQQLATQGVARAREHFSIEALAQQLCRLVNRVG